MVGIDAAWEPLSGHLVHPLQAGPCPCCLCQKSLHGQGAHEFSRSLILVFVTGKDFLPESLMFQFFAHFLLGLRNREKKKKKLGFSCPTNLTGLNNPTA